MTMKTNILAAAFIAAATLFAMPAANAGVAAGQMGAVAMPVTATGSATAEVQLVGGRRWHHGHRWHGGARWGGYGWGGYGYYAPVYYGGGCHRLKRKWHRTGSRYWKKRYFRCINSY